MQKEFGIQSVSDKKTREEKRALVASADRTSNDISFWINWSDDSILQVPCASENCIIYLKKENTGLSVECKTQTCLQIGYRNIILHISITNILWIFICVYCSENKSF